jgi:hypothetical protein
VTATLPPRIDTVADAINRLDDGDARPGDELRADRYDAQCSQSYEGWQERMWRVQDAAALEAHREFCDGCDHCEVAA